MTKSELIDAVAEAHGIPRRIAEEVVHGIFDSMKAALVGGGRIEVRGFGSFKVREYKGYTGRNPKTGQAIQVRPKKLPVFKVSKVLKASLDREISEG